MQPLWTHSFILISWWAQDTSTSWCSQLAGCFRILVNLGLLERRIIFAVFVIILDFFQGLSPCGHLIIWWTFLCHGAGMLMEVLLALKSIVLARCCFNFCFHLISWFSIILWQSDLQRVVGCSCCAWLSLIFGLREDGLVRLDFELVNVWAIWLGFLHQIHL